MRNVRRRTDRFLAHRLDELDPDDLAALDRAVEILDRVTEPAE
jgi:hypothetical protein